MGHRYIRDPELRELEKQRKNKRTANKADWAQTRHRQYAAMHPVVQPPASMAAPEGKQWVATTSNSGEEKPEEIRASHILVSTEDEARNVLEQLKAGADFAETARALSSCNSKHAGGDLGPFSRGKMVKEFEDVAFSLAVGQISDPVKTQFGYHIIKVTAR